MAEQSSREKQREQNRKDQDQNAEKTEGATSSLLAQQKANVGALMKDRRENPPQPRLTDDGEPANIQGFRRRESEADGPFTGIADLARRLNQVSGDLVVAWNSRGEQWRKDKLKELDKIVKEFKDFRKAEPGIYEVSEQTGYRPEDPRHVVMASADEVGEPEVRKPGEHKGAK